MALRRYELRVDVSGVVPHLEEAELAATLIVPDKVEERHRTLAVGFPGAFCSRGYWDIDHTGGYSQAAYHAERGWLFVAIDHLGVGDSSKPDQSLLTLETLAVVNDVASRWIVDGLGAGTLVAGLGPVSIQRVIGVGHSTGGCIALIAQGRHRTFDRLAVLGYGAVHSVLPSPDGPTDVPPASRGGTEVDASKYSRRELGSDMIIWMLHWEDVDPALRAADVGSGFPIRRTMPPWGTAYAPSAFASAIKPGAVTAEAEAIEAPLFLAAGERDVCPDLRAEAAVYRSVRDMTLTVVPRMAHMHNFASTRHQLWARLHAWGEALA
jgi:pimeloyl-ACP methyl ester carboxylesterase